MKLTNKYLKFGIVLSLFFFGSLFQLIPIKIFNLNLDNISATQNIYLSMFSNAIVVIILIALYYNDLKDDFQKFKKNIYDILDQSFKIWCVGLILMAIFNVIINHFSPNEIANNEEAIRSMIKVSPILMLFNTAIMAPLIEELVFRKSFRTIFKNNLAFVLISGIIFGSLHVLLADIENIYDYLYLLPYCSLGIAFSYMYYKTDNIWGPISMHMFHNSIMTITNIIALGMILC